MRSAPGNNRPRQPDQSQPNEREPCRRLPGKASEAANLETRVGRRQETTKPQRRKTTNGAAQGIASPCRTVQSGNDVSTLAFAQLALGLRLADPGNGGSKAVVS